VEIKPKLDMAKGDKLGVRLDGELIESVVADSV
jgi:hypothetical protein